MNKKLKVGLLGAGFIVDSHAKALKVLPNVEITAICDREISRAEDTAKREGIKVATRKNGDSVDIYRTA